MTSAPEPSLDDVAHTPGPFEAIKGIDAYDDVRCSVVARRGSERYLVATIENGAPGDFCDTEYANALLFAAAPELLKQLTTALQCIEMTGQCLGDMAGMRAAIAKATGQHLILQDKQEKR